MNKKAFTLIELLVAMAIISIMVVWVTNIDFKWISNKDRLEIFVIKIISEIETVRNNSLIWKWIWTNLTVPEKWKIEISKKWSWSLLTTSYSWTTALAQYNFPFQEFYSIDSISCWKINEVNNSLSNTLNSTQSWTIVFEQWNITLSDKCDKNQKIEITVKYKEFEKKIYFNSVNWLIKSE